MIGVKEIYPLWIYLSSLVEAENWDGEELSSTDIDNLIPMVEPEKEKSQVGGDLWGDVEPDPQM